MAIRAPDGANNDSNNNNNNKNTGIIGAGKCIVEFEKMSTAVMEDVGTFTIKIVRLGDTTNQVKRNPHYTSCDLI